MSVFSFELKSKLGKEVLITDTLSCLQIEEESSIHDVIRLYFLQHELVDRNIQKPYFQVAKHLCAPAKISYRNM